MNYQIALALRHLGSKRMRGVPSLNTWISAGGVAVGVMALLTVLSVMGGLHKDLHDKILGVGSHITISMPGGGAFEDFDALSDRLEGVDGVVAAAPSVRGAALIAGAARSQGIDLRGIDPRRESKLSAMEGYMVAGTLDALGAEPESGVPGIVMGMELADRLGLLVGETVKVVSPYGGLGPGGNIPRTRTFRLVGLFEVGMFEFDGNMALIPIADAQEFMDYAEGEASHIALRVSDPIRAQDMKESLAGYLPEGAVIKSWGELNANLFSALKLEKLAMFLILTLVVAVAALNIVGTQSMGVLEKEREIAILRTMGSTAVDIRNVFMAQGLIIGVAGALTGTVFSMTLCWLINTFELIRLPADVYYISHVPAIMNVWDFIAVPLCAIAISFVATLYPARRAAELDPVEPLRYE